MLVPPINIARLGSSVSWLEEAFNDSGDQSVGCHLFQGFPRERTLLPGIADHARSAAFDRRVATRRWHDRSRLEPRRLADLCAVQHAILHANLEICVILAILKNRKLLFI
jgi:hypothetical protein